MGEDRRVIWATVAGNRRRVPISLDTLFKLREGWGASHVPFWMTEVMRAYLKMAQGKNAYRPEAPNDGFGSICLDEEELDDPVRLEIEAWLQARKFYDEDAAGLFEIHGCSDGRMAATMFLCLHAAQLCCGGMTANTVRKVLNQALADLPDKGKK